MALTSGLYVATFAAALKNTLAIDLDSGTDVICLYTSTATNNLDTDAAHTATNELGAGGGYTQHSKPTGTATCAGTGSGGILKYTWSAAVTWSSASFTANGMIVGHTTTFEPIVAVAFGGDYTATNGDFTITPHGNGIFTIDCNPGA